MIDLIDTLGPAIWRASWQAAALAVLVVILLRCSGDRLAPRWRFRLWGLVLVRLLLVVTPVSPWSMFNLMPRKPVVRSLPMTETRAASMPAAPNRDFIPDTHRVAAEPTRVASVEREPEGAQAISQQKTTLPLVESVTQPSIAEKAWFDADTIPRILCVSWLAGSLLMTLRLLATALSLRRRLSACRRVTDAYVLSLVEQSCRRLGLRRMPMVLVTPDCLGPCVVGMLFPRIVLPESVVVLSPQDRLRHVLAHELAHLVRFDLWTNWLLLTARILHWFNPVAWWTVREMQAEREAACDELVFAALSEVDRSAYAATIVELAASLSQSALAPGLIGLFSSTSRLRTRIERLLRSPSTTFKAPLAGALLLGMAVIGLTDASPAVQSQEPKQPVPTKEELLAKLKARNHTVTGRVVNHNDSLPMAGVLVRLYQIEGRTAPPIEIARTETDADGRYSFSKLTPPRREDYYDRLDYSVLGFMEGRPVGIGFMHFQNREMVVEIRMAREHSSITGKVVDATGRPIVGANVQQEVMQRSIPGVLSTKTDAEGRFAIDKIPVYKTADGRPQAASFSVTHQDHPRTTFNAGALPTDVLVTLPAGCVVTGTVTDKVTAKPAGEATITARRVDEWGEYFVDTDPAGRFRLVVPEGRYHFLAEGKDRVCPAVTDQECTAGKKVELPQFSLVSGGIISGKVINTASGQTVSVTTNGDPIMLGFHGPSQPQGRFISPARLAAVDSAGRFQLRAIPGENFPYFVNHQGDRMSWNTRKQPPVVVKEGETTAYDMLITPPVPPEVKLAAARKLVDAMPKAAAERTAQILGEFRKLNRTVDETELWCTLMRELVAVGRDAVPALCTELDQTKDNVSLRRLAFALRAIGDPRAVPALIRAIPRTLLPSGSDYGLIVADKDLTEFMQKHSLDKQGGTHFSFGRPVRELFPALQQMTGQNFDDAEIYGISLSEDPRRQVLQRRLYTRQAQRWQTWWESNGHKLTNEAAYLKVNLIVGDQALPPAPKPEALGKSARLVGEWSEYVLSPSIEGGRYASYFYDLDTGYCPKWPTGIPKKEASRDSKALADWISKNGVDLMCVTHRAADGTETFVLRAIGMKVWEINLRDVRNLDKTLATGKLPEGRPVGELLMHFDAQSGQLVPNANAAFIFITREGSLGLIETTDRVTRVENLNGAAGVPQGVGFNLGVRFNLSAIVP